MDKLIERFQHSVRLNFHFSPQEEQNDDDNTSTGTDADTTVTYIPLLYIPSTWDPPPKLDHVELSIGKFDACLNKMKRALPTCRWHNLSLLQCNVISELWTQKDLVIFQTDKILGPSVAHHSKYIQDVLETHLLNNNNYEFLPLAVAQ